VKRRRVGAIERARPPIPHGSRTFGRLAGPLVALLALVAGAAHAENPPRAIDRAVSGDGRYVLVALAEPPRLSIRRSDGQGEIKSLPIRIEGGRVSAPSALGTVPERESFLVALANLPELWEISYADRPAYRGWVHDHRDDGPPSEVARFPLRRIPLKEPLGQLGPSPDGEHLVGAAAGSTTLHFVDLRIGRVFASLELDIALALSSGRIGGGTIVEVSAAKSDEIVVLDVAEGRVLSRLPLAWPTKN